MAQLLNPTSRRLALAAFRRLSVPAAADPLVSCRSAQERYSSSLVNVRGGFDDMLASTQRFYVIGGKGGVGKTSVAASLALKFANQGERTLIASMDPTHSLGDLFEQRMTSDGKSIRINGFDFLFSAQIGHVEIKRDTSEARSWINNILGKIGMGIPMDPAINSKLDEILNRFPPGIKEALTISQLIGSVELQGGDKFRRIVLDSVSTGHTLKLLSDADWIEKSISMAIKAVNAVPSQPIPKSLRKEQVDAASAWLREFLEEFRQCIGRAREVLYNPQSTEFIIVTIPTMMAVTESARYHASLKKNGAHVRRLVVNQVLPPSASDCRFCAAKRREEARAFNAIRTDGELGGLNLVQVPLLDAELKGVPALRFLSDSVWR